MYGLATGEGVKKRKKQSREIKYFCNIKLAERQRRGGSGRDAVNNAAACTEKVSGCVGEEFEDGVFLQGLFCGLAILVLERGSLEANNFTSGRRDVLVYVVASALPLLQYHMLFDCTSEHS